MIGKPRIGNCDVPGCNAKNVIIAKKLPSIGNLCSSCNEERLKDAKLKRGEAPKTKKLSGKRKPTGEGVMFEAIWASRPHRSFVSGKPLGNEAKAHFFAHVLGKGAYPSFRLLMENVVLLTEDEHYAWDFGGREKLKSDPAWDKMFDLELKLKQRYHEKNREADL